MTNWITLELNGYPDDEDPPWRHVSVQVDWRLRRGGPTVAQSSQEVCVRTSVGELYAFRSDGCELSLGRQGPTYEGERLAGFAKIGSESIEQVLQKISSKLFDQVSKHVTTLKFGEVVESVFREYQASVSQAMSKLGIEDYLKNAYENLLGKDEASCQSSALACRNVLYALSEKLYRTTGDTYPYLKEGIKVTHDKPRNRIKAYLHQKGMKSDSLLMVMVDPLYGKASAGKGPISYEDAQSVLINTYIFLGELARCTDMEPVTMLCDPGQQV